MSCVSDSDVNCAGQEGGNIAPLFVNADSGTIVFILRFFSLLYIGSLLIVAGVIGRVSLGPVVRPLHTDSPDCAPLLSDAVLIPQLQLHYLYSENLMTRL